MSSTISGTFVVSTAQAAPPGPVTGFGVVLSGDQARASWSGPAGTVEIVQADASGNPTSLISGGVALANGTGEEAYDPQGVIAFFASATPAVFDLPAGTTVRFMARACNGSGPSAVCGPWTAPVAVTTPPGTPHFVLSGFSASMPRSGYGTVTFVVTNDGTAAGDPGYFSAAWAQNGNTINSGISGSAQATVGQIEPGQSRTVTIQSGYPASDQAEIGVFVNTAASVALYAVQGVGYYFGGYYTASGQLVQTGNTYQPGRPFPGRVANDVALTVNWS